MSEDTSAEKHSRLRVDGDTPIFITDKATRENTVYNWLQNAVAENGGVNGDSGLSVESAVNYMLNNFKPKKSQKFGRAYCRAYVVSGVKDGYLTTDRLSAATEVQTIAPGQGGKSSASGGGGALSKAAKQILDKLGELIDEDDYRSDADVVTIQSLAEALDKSVSGVGRGLKGLESRGLVEVKPKKVEVPQEDPEAKPKTATVKYVYLTEEGYKNAVVGS